MYALDEIILPHFLSDLFSFSKLTDLLNFENTELAIQDCVAFSGVLITSIVWIKLGRILSDHKVIDKTLSRKLVHITTAPLFLLCWVFFSSEPEARYLAAFIPVFNLVRSLMSGFGIFHDGDFIHSMTRNGRPHELLLGPSFYAMTLIGVTLMFWRSSWISFLTIGILAGGDGMAEIIGRRFGTIKLPYNECKSLEGTLAMISFGFIFSIGLMEVFHGVGFLPLLWSDGKIPYFWTLVVCICCGFVESLPIDSKVNDNISVPMTSALLGLIIQRHSH